MVESGYCRYNYKCAYFKKFIIIRTINIIIIIIKEKYFALVVELWSKLSFSCTLKLYRYLCIETYPLSYGVQKFEF